MKVNAWLIALIVIGSSLSCSFESNNPVFYSETNPKLLSEWNLFHSVEKGKQLIPRSSKTFIYSLNSSLFTDYADKLRTITMPEGSHATLQSNGVIDFPQGTVISKTFSYPSQLMETRLLVNRANGWEALPYVWNVTQQDAQLKRTGAVLQPEANQNDIALVEGTIPTNYIVPNVNQCAGCHQLDQSSKQIQPIGPTIKSIPLHQLQQWLDAGYLVVASNQSLAQVASANHINVDWNDEAQPLQQRARAYLDINCGHCHSPTGPGDTSGLYLNNANVDAVRLGVCKAPIAAGQGTGGNQFSIVPGHPEQSIMTYRLNSIDPGAMMPELGRTLVHREGSDLIAQWIASMPSKICNENPNVFPGI